MILTEYETAMGLVLGSAVDTSTWTTAIKDQGLRDALVSVTSLWVYEATVTVTVAGYEQAIAPSGVATVLAVLYPWDDTVAWGDAGEEAYHFVGENKVRFERVELQVNDEIRVRYTKVQTVNGLDGAVATTVPAAAEDAVMYLACAAAADIRYRQISENPAIPNSAGAMLAQWARAWRKQAEEWLSAGPATGVGRVSWGGLGLG